MKRFDCTWPVLKRKIHHPFKSIQLIEWSNYLKVKSCLHYPFKWIQSVEWYNYLKARSCLHLSNWLKECGKFLWMRLWNLCFISMKESNFVKLQAASLSRLDSFISIFKGFAKPVSYLALRFSKLGTTFFKKYLLQSEHTTSLQCHKTSIRRQDVV